MLLLLFLAHNHTHTGILPFAVDFSSPEDYLIILFQMAFATCTVLVAGTVALAILRTRALRLQNRFIFMLNTSVSDTLVGVSVYYQGLFDVQEGFPSRNGTYNLLPSLLGVNILTFLFAQFDRYFAVCQPFFYARRVSRRVVISINVYCWFHVYAQTMLLNCVPIAQASKLYVYNIVFLQLIVLVKVCMTVKLYAVARQQLEREPASSVRESNRESLRIIVFVVVTFLLLWGPSFINIVLRLLTGKGLVFRNEATNAFAVMARLNALCTPTVYLWGSPALREACRARMWGRVCPGCRGKRTEVRPGKVH